MAGDLINFRLSGEANAVAEQLKDSGKFEDAITAAKFGLAYALKYHFGEIDPRTYRITDQNGSNYSVGSLDNDSQLRALLVALYPGTDTPYVYARALIIFGLLKIGERIRQEGFQSVSALL